MVVSLACETLVALLELSSKEVNIIDKTNQLEMETQQKQCLCFPRSHRIFQKGGPYKALAYGFPETTEMGCVPITDTQTQIHHTSCISVPDSTC